MTRARAILASLVLAAAVAGAAAALRFEVVEPAAMGQACLDAAGPWWCALRDTLVRAFRAELFGYLSLALAVGALVVPSRALGALAIATGAAGLVLYNAGLAAAGIVLGLVRLVRR